MRWMLRTCWWLSSIIASSHVYAEVNTPEQNYLLKCSGCHTADGSGSVAGGIPPLPGYLGAFMDDPQGRVYIMNVPGVIASGLDDKQLADLMNYLNHKWGDPEKAKPYTAAEIERIKAKPLADVVKYRREIVARFNEQGIATGSYPWP